MSGCARMCTAAVRAATAWKSYVVPRTPAAGTWPLAPRLLHTTRVVRASEDPRGQLESALPPGFEKLGESPAALMAIQNLMDVMQKNGIDLSSGEKPSLMQMAKLATNAEVRAATSKVVEEVRKAGIDLSPENLQNLMKNSGYK